MVLNRFVANGGDTPANSITISFSKTFFMWIHVGKKEKKEDNFTTATARWNIQFGASTQLGDLGCGFIPTQTKIHLLAEQPMTVSPTHHYRWHSDSQFT